MHVGVEEPFAPARKAHAALLIEDVDALDRAASRLDRLGFVVDRGERRRFPGYLRLHTYDGGGNRVELLADLPKRGLDP